MPSDQEEQVLCKMLGSADEMDEGGGIQRTTGRIEEDLAGSGVLFKERKAGRNDLAHGALGVTAGALEEFAGDGVGMLIARFADEIDEDFHGVAGPDFRHGVPVPTAIGGWAPVAKNKEKR